ncbi:phosphonate metabolism transcriptional regulator PhnF [Pseudoduganella umbonata]|uniref:GntR family phosphonate transport system transcriptional regulator n=1 Tax=Pseudoduganella umbonata TaxID=864828 RepID=A0A4P8HYB0_9BURK|nr:phosphonate metabolism transcriptional regulator PhnF [Pseudoduganella umbonata]MBB3223447.1 GntR family phosphonate transport system transcriptional regulator [Pseudoduganella umbonata]QCP13660.1 phosphonate metabolism transcriptional regulator PhnF [Pseudoduganella umbonata]
MSENLIVRQAGTTVWKQIQESLGSDILAGRLLGRLPNETELAERFAVNRHTVRQAVKALVEQGMVEVVHGRGTFVREDFLDYRIGRRTRLAHSVVKARRVGKSEILGWESVRPPADIAALLELSSRAKTLAIDSLDVVDGKVIGVCTQYFPLPRFEGFGEAYREAGKTHVALARFGIPQFQRKLSRITARMPGSEVAQQLGQPASLPILYVETVYVDQEGKPFEYGISSFSSAAVQLVIEPD